MSEERKWEELAAKLNDEHFDAEALPEDDEELSQATQADGLLKANKQTLLSVAGVNSESAWYRLKTQKERFSRKQLWVRVAGAAAAAVFMFGSGYYLKNLMPNDSQIAQPLTTLSIPKAAMGNVVLADGTRVYLNSDTELKYTDQPSGKREVYLNGEAYFEVTSDKSNPFYVHLNDFTIKVTGTMFNVKSYQDDNAETSLIEGKISILNPSGSELLDLKPDQTMLFEKDSRRMVVSDTPGARCDWRDGELFLKNKPLSEIAKTLERWYDIKLTFDDESIRNTCLTGTILKNKPIEQILEVLKISEPLHYEYEYKDQRLVEIKVSYRN